MGTIYCLEYDLLKLKDNKKEHRKELYADLGEFIERVKYLNDSYYASDLKVYKAEPIELSLNKVIQPF